MVSGCFAPYIELNVMVFFVVTSEGYKELCRTLIEPPSPLWVCEGVLTEAETGTLRSSGTSITVFNRVISSKDAGAIEEALYTITQHHPDERIWVEREHDV